MIITLGVALLSGGAALGGSPETAAELKKLEGRWLVAHRSYTPSKVTDPVAKLLTALGHRVEIKDGKLSALDADKEGTAYEISFDPAKNPKAVNLTVPGEKRQVLLGIYSLEDDILCLEFGTGKSRPKERLRPDDQVQLILKRAKDQGPAADGSGLR
jgi:uncharacterized protein (TIGR03067 family)